MTAQNKEETMEEEDSLDRELNAQVSEQLGGDGDQTEEVTNPGHKEASGGHSEEGTATENVTAPVPPSAV